MCPSHSYVCGSGTYVRGGWQTGGSGTDGWEWHIQVGGSGTHQCLQQTLYITTLLTTYMALGGLKQSRLVCSVHPSSNRTKCAYYCQLQTQRSTTTSKSDQAILGKYTYVYIRTYARRHAHTYVHTLMCTRTHYKRRVTRERVQIHTSGPDKSTH